MITESLHTDSLPYVARGLNLRLLTAYMGSLCFSSLILLLEHICKVVEYVTETTIDSQNYFRE